MNLAKMIGNLIKIIAVLFGFWLSICVMLAGGLIQAIEGFQAGDVATGVWGAIRAIFFEFGMIPAYILWLGGDICKDC